MDVSVIIVNYNTLRLTRECIESVFNKTKEISFEIILIDNASKDGSKEYFEKNKNITYIYLDRNLGFGQANNKAAEQAKGEYVFFLNSDTILVNNAIKILYDYIRLNPNVGAVGGNLYTQVLTPTISFERRFSGVTEDLNMLSHGIIDRLCYSRNRLFNYTEEPIEVAYISGADLMISKQLFKNIGGFSSDFFMYYEETDLCFRIKKMGFSVVSLPAARIIHLEGGSQKKDTEAQVKKAEMLTLSRQIFMRRNHGKMYRYIDRALLTLFYRLKILKGKDVEISRIIIKQLQSVR